MTEPRASILAIDDTPVNLKLLKATLQQDFDVRTASSGAEGLALAREQKPDLILLDVLMPEMDGYETCRRLKADSSLMHIPVVFVTGQSDPLSEAAGLALGAADYIPKPVKVGITRQRIQNLLDREKLRKQVETQRDQLEAQLQQSSKLDEQLRLAASVFAHAREGIAITGMDGKIVDVNAAFTRITGYTRDDVLGRNPNVLSSGRQDKAFYDAMWQSLVQQGHWCGEIWNRRKSGEVYAEMLTISTVRDAQGQPQQYVALFSDITAAKEHQTQLERIAHYDALTNLPNRVLLSDRMRQALAQSLRRGQLLSVAYIDLDGFKAVNDLHGHEVGDQMLVALAHRMKQMLREGDTLARLGGDEFVAVLVDLPDASASVPTLSRLLAVASQPVVLGNVVVQVAASVGVTFYPQAEDVDADQLLRQADQAMYQAKLAGKNRYHVFDDEQDRSVRGHHESLDRIRLALADSEFVLHYQPKVNMRTGQVVGAEALIRWQHPQRGLLAPSVFLPVIEDHPLSIDVGEWVIDAALTQMERWHQAGLRIPVSVNVGARHLQSNQFVTRLKEIQATHPTVQAHELELELLETSALEDLLHISTVIEACHRIGVNFALDDFGTGYSSLTYLKRLPVHQLKIDQSFVRDMLDDPDDLAILEGVIGLASAFGRQVIAEGVETVEHGNMLLQLGCDLAQGYGVARPMPGTDLPHWVSEWTPFPSWTTTSMVPREDLPLLAAAVGHRAWVQALEQHLQNNSTSPPPLDPHRCQFGTWLKGPGLTRHGDQQAYAGLEDIHHRLHELADQLCSQHANYPAAQAHRRMPEVRALSTELLDKLKDLLSPEA